MALRRADRLKEPPVVGRHYMVPAILWQWRAPFSADPQSGGLWWPVIGPKHDDKEFFAFHYKHYHTDPRFFSKRHWNHLFDRLEGGKLLDAVASPLNSTALPDGPPRPTLRKMRCSMDAIPYPEWTARAAAVCKLNEHYAGTQCAKGKRGWVCPHRLVPLGAMKPIAGVITCFLHGLRVDAETGVCLGPVT